MISKHFLFYILFLLCISCNKKKAETNDGRNLEVFLGANNNKMSVGYWTFYDEYNNLIMELDCSKDAGNTNFIVKQYDSKHKVIYEAYYINGKITDEKSCGDFQRITYANGRYLYNKYIRVYYEQEYGKIQNKKYNFMILKVNFARLQRKYKKIPKLTDNEIKAILCFFNPEGADKVP